MTCSKCTHDSRRDIRCMLGFHDFDKNKCEHEQPVKCRRAYCHNEKDFGD